MASCDQKPSDSISPDAPASLKHAVCPFVSGHLIWELVASALLPGLKQTSEGCRFRCRQDSRFVCQTQLAAEQLLDEALCCRSLSSFQMQPESQASSLPLVHRIFVCDEGRDLLSCLSVWAGCRVCSPHPLLPHSLSACLAALPQNTSAAPTTKTPFADSESVPACPGIPTGGENSLPHCYTLIACQVPFPVCALVIFPPLSPHFLTLSLPQLFSLLATHPVFMSRFPLRLLYFYYPSCL